MALTNSLLSVLQVCASRQNKEDRKSFTLLLADVSQKLSDDFQANCRALGEDRHRAEANLSLVMTVRTVWAITPERLFTSADPNYEQLAAVALKDLVGAGSDSSAVHALSRIFRHLRRADREGRRYLTSLDLTKSAHRDLLAAQANRCAVCRYPFADHELAYVDTDEDVFVQPRTPMTEEVTLEVYRRRPVLDHIIPHFLGGDGPENWQVLCGSCNSGKGDGLAWILRRGMLPSARPSEARQISPSLRYAVLSSFLGGTSLPAPDQTGELRIFRRDKSRLPVFDNLRVLSECEQARGP